MRIILSGAIGRSVTGGCTWVHLQYLLGLKQLGHEVYYLEDVGDWFQAYNWDTQEPTDSPDYPAGFVREIEDYGFVDRWIYRVGNDSRGFSLDRLRQICADADLLIILGVPMIEWRPEYNLPRRRIFIDIDPGFTQIRLANGEPAFVETISKCERLFTIAQRIGMNDCRIPTAGRDWLKTASPVALDAWPVTTPADRAPFTTIVRWRGVNDVEYNGVEYGQRDREFPKFVRIPEKTTQTFKVALTGGNISRLRSYGWEVISGWEASRDTKTYQQFIQQSKAEFGIAKHCYVATRGGWFSDRSACFLASGRPVLVQDTGISDWLPTGSGVLTFQDEAEAIDKIEKINLDYEFHSAQARSIAEEYLSTSIVLSRFLSAATE